MAIHSRSVLDYEKGKLPAALILHKTSTVSKSTILPSLFDIFAKWGNDTFSVPRFNLFHSVVYRDNFFPLLFDITAVILIREKIILYIK